MGKLQKLRWVFGLATSFTAYASSPDVLYENASNSPLFQLIQSSQTSIDIEIYEIEDVRVQKAVLSAMDRGVRVRIIQESEAVASGCSIFEKSLTTDSIDCKGQKTFMQKVRSKGGTYVPFAYDQFCTEGKGRCLEHGKLMIVDGQQALISTGNFNASNLCDPAGKPQSNVDIDVQKGRMLETCNRDYSVVSSDPNVVSTLTAVFEADLKSHAYDLSKILNHVAASKVTVSPHSLDPIVQFIRSAKKSIQIENQYLKDPQMNAELIAAAKRGVKVSLVVTSACAFGPLDPKRDSSTIKLWKNTYTAFDQAGIKTRIFTKQIKVGGLSGYLHSKAIVVDENRAWVGSVNGSTQALSKNREFGIFIDHAAEVKKLSSYLTADFQNPNTESWQESLVCKKD